MYNSYLQLPNQSHVMLKHVYLTRFKLSKSLWVVFNYHTDIRTYSWAAGWSLTSMENYDSHNPLHFTLSLNRRVAKREESFWTGK